MIRGYIFAVREFAEHYGKSPECLGAEELSHYQMHLLQQRKLAPNTVEGRISALRFLYRKVLKRRDLTTIRRFQRLRKTAGDTESC